MPLFTAHHPMRETAFGTSLLSHTVLSTCPFTEALYLTGTVTRTQQEERDRESDITPVESGCRKDGPSLRSVARQIAWWTRFSLSSSDRFQCGKRPVSDSSPTPCGQSDAQVRGRSSSSAQTDSPRKAVLTSPARRPQRPPQAGRHLVPVRQHAEDEDGTSTPCLALRSRNATPHTARSSPACFT
jgi:hypothetical protein